MKKRIAVLALCLYCITANAQSTGINTVTPDASAALDVVSSSKGILVPRVTTTQRTTGIAAPAKGLLVYDSTLNNFYYFNGASWTTVGGSGAGISSVGLQLYATSTQTQSTNSYGFNRYSFNFDNVIGGSSLSAWTSNNTYTVPAGMGGVYNINLSMIVTAYTYTTVPVVYPEIQVTSGSSVVYYYGLGNGSALLAGNNTNTTSAGSSGTPYSYARGIANVDLPLQAGDVVKVFFRTSLNATSSSQTVSFSTDGSSYLSIKKLN